jgi:predicted secreted protein
VLRIAVVIIAATAALAIPATAGAKIVSVGASSNNKTVHLKRGDTLKITLTEVADGGAHWRTLLKPQPTVLRLTASRYVAPHLPPGAVGGEGTRVNRYRALGHGTTRLRLGYFGPGRGAKAVKHYRLTVIVA